MSTLVHSWEVLAQTGTGPTTGLNFPSKGDSPSSAFVAFQFMNPQNDGLPFSGPSNQGATYMWKYAPRQQTGYYVTMWYSRSDGTFENGHYYGGHPYPQGGGDTTSSHYWEIAHSTLDDVNTIAGSPVTVVKDGSFYSQALRVIRNANSSLTLRFYIRLPAVGNGDIIESTTNTGYDTTPPSPAITFGDSPWYPEYGHERMSGIVRGIKIFSKQLSQADILSEEASDDLVTSEGIANIWYKKVNPDPNNLLCEAGTGRNPTWAQATHATLWTP